MKKQDCSAAYYATHQPAGAKMTQFTLGMEESDQSVRSAQTKQIWRNSDLTPLNIVYPLLEINMKELHPQPKYKPKVVEVRRSSQSLEDEAPKVSMASPITEATPVIVLRPSWLDLPANRLLRRITLIGVCSIPAAIILTVAIHAAWRIL